ncbi:MAG: DEAD/DEAH box helicase family protein, partial [Eubacteriales bacterium]|nr:DEAD/DEAH box helicase family protein [Eubacteriales bacterium]
VAVREFPTSTGEVDYALFVDGKPVGVVEAKREETGQSITDVEVQSGRYANSRFKWVKNDYRIRFVYEATDKLIRFTDYKDAKYRSRSVFSFHRPETLFDLLQQPDTIRNNMKHFPPLDVSGFRKCQINAINNLDQSFADNRPKALVQMATGAGKTFTAITAAYRLLKYGKMKRILFLVDTKGLGEQAEREFLAYTPNDDPRSFSQIYGVRRLKSSYIPNDIQICISTIQRMYSILKEEELDESAEEAPFAEYVTAESKEPKEVVYNEKYPPEFFDCIIVDECHRSIYNVWSQVLAYFDAFIVGLTATPDSRTFAFFDENIVSEYSREQAIVDNVNVGEDVFLIETQIGRNGAHLMKQMIEHRDRLSRAKRWQQMDEDVDYVPSQLDKKIVNPSQIRTVVRSFKENLFTALFPRRNEVPKTLIFAKSNSHADDIVQIVREEFGEGNKFCRKITYAVDNPESVLNSFRNDYNPRIAVTVDMIATGIDVKPIECLIFMRDVKSKNYFEQMKGRGTRVLSKEDLKKVTPSATENKDHFVIVDAVGVTKSRKSDTRPLERKPAVSMKELMMNVALGAKDEDTLTSLANRVIRLNSQMTPTERKKFEEKVGASAGIVAENLLND